MIALLVVILVVTAWVRMLVWGGRGNMKSPFMHKTVGLILIILAVVVMPGLGVFRPKKVEVRFETKLTKRYLKKRTTLTHTHARACTACHRGS